MKQIAPGDFNNLFLILIDFSLQMKYYSLRCLSRF